MEDVKDAVEDLTDPTVAQGIILGISEPSSDQIDLSSLEGVEAGTVVTLFLAEASDPSALEDSPVEGATVTVQGDASVEARDEGAGLYLVEPGVLTYEVGASWQIDIDDAGTNEPASLSMVLPDAVDIDVPEEWDVGMDLELDFLSVCLEPI